MSNRKRAQALLVGKNADILQLDLFTGRKIPVLQRIHAMTAAPTGKYGCTIWTGSVRTADGRPQIHDGTGKDRRGLQVSRVVMEHKLGRKLSRKEHVLHDPRRCSQDPRCVCPSHLYIGDDQQNAADRAISGHSTKRKFTADQAREVAKMCDERPGQYVAIAAELGVDPSTVRRIDRGNTHAKATGRVHIKRPTGRPRKDAIAKTRHHQKEAARAVG